MTADRRIVSADIGNESVLKIMINDTAKLFFENCNRNFGNFKQ